MSPNPAVLRVIVGSQAYGVATDQSDTDIIAITVDSPQHLIGLGSRTKATVQRDAGHGERSRAGDTETTTYRLRHFVQLASQGNPHLLDPLFAAPDMVLEVTDLGRQLRQMRHAFLSVRTVHRCLGYAESQKQLLLGRGTRQSRMPKRRELIEMHGYDTKYAGHILRLGIQAHEVATTGDLQLPMYAGDRDLVRAVRAGQVALSGVLSRFDAYADATRKVLNSGRCAVPERPDIASVDRWLIDAHRDCWGWG
ncbi:putative nucleotidyltransferase [Branchiibius hedensis]|uniref:Predicted nucleotidyltransferase n=2 Tax=Branchiibius TaxID=908251 RepID=A0A2Y8ZQ22_9MICO|nr:MULTISPECIES: nucleotidyltransferase domain-containing protein [Branchiibius]PWJ25648.1 putative nucleotidyltransferase [Branchiibius hedensis]SSA34461.1 Predicted nucleotidyltransferase [Branchiibius hedensis]